MRPFDLTTGNEWSSASATRVYRGMREEALQALLARDKETGSRYTGRELRLAANAAWAKFCQEPQDEQAAMLRHAQQHAVMRQKIWLKTVGTPPAL